MSTIARSRLQLAAVFLVSVAIGACAARTYNTAVAVDRSIASALFAAQDAARELRTAEVISEADYRAFNQRLVPALEAGQSLNRALQTWTPDTPRPATVTDALLELRRMLSVLVATSPSQLQPVLTRALAIIGEVQ